MGATPLSSLAPIHRPWSHPLPPHTRAQLAPQPTPTRSISRPKGGIIASNRPVGCPNVLVAPGGRLGHFAPSVRAVNAILHPQKRTPPAESADLATYWHKSWPAGALRGPVAQNRSSCVGHHPSAAAWPRGRAGRTPWPQVGGAWLVCSLVEGSQSSIAGPHHRTFE
jgi:hypothetical protein